MSTECDHDRIFAAFDSRWTNFPKRTEIAHYTQAELDDVAAELNGRPRQTLGFKTPSQALDEVLR